MDKGLLKSLKYMVVMINVILTIVLASMLLGLGLSAGTYINTRRSLNQLEQTIDTYNIRTEVHK